MNHVFMPPIYEYMDLNADIILIVFSIDCFFVLYIYIYITQTIQELYNYYNQKHKSFNYIRTIILCYTFIFWKQLDIYDTYLSTTFI